MADTGNAADAIVDGVGWEEVDEGAQEEIEDVDSPDDDDTHCAGIHMDDDAEEVADEGPELERDLRLRK